MGEINDIRISATSEDLERWQWLFEEMEKRGLITVYETSKNYPNRGDSKLSRKYFKIKLNAEKNPE
jgi:hypothetical protein